MNPLQHEDLRLPVTVLSGFLGAGKTTLLQEVLNRSAGRRVAVLVNDMSEVNIDAELLARGEQGLRRGEERLVELSNGCICCTLREDLMEQVRELSEAGLYDYLLIESTGIGEPQPVAETFAFVDEAGRSLSDVARLDTMVTVVDATRFVRDFHEGVDLAAIGQARDDEDERTLTDLLVEQVEFADVLVLNKTDLVSDADLTEVEVRLRALNPGALLHRSIRGRVDPGEILGTQRFDFARAKTAPGWMKAMQAEPVSEIAEYGIQSFVFQAREPFHPVRLNALFHDDAFWRGILRSKGFFWVASDHRYAYSWSQAGGVSEISPAGRYWASLEKVYWPDDEQPPFDERENWDPMYGDRAQELVFIGQQLDESAMRDRLNSCLLEQALIAGGSEAWAALPHPFPLPTAGEES